MLDELLDLRQRLVAFHDDNENIDVEEFEAWRSEVLKNLPEEYQTRMKKIELQEKVIPTSFLDDIPF